MKDMAPISIQLYSLREASTKNFDQVLNEVADIGYKGVEPFHLFGNTPAEFRKQVEDLGMRVSSSRSSGIVAFVGVKPTDVLFSQFRNCE